MEGNEKLAYRRLVAGLDEQLERLERGEEGLVAPQPAAVAGVHSEGQAPSGAKADPRARG
jgi:hypothetical protein